MSLELELEGAASFPPLLNFDGESVEEMLVEGSGHSVSAGKHIVVAECPDAVGRHLRKALELHSVIVDASTELAFRGAAPASCRIPSWVFRSCHSALTFLEAGVDMVNEPCVPDA